jgi:hypothetical protein
MHIHLAADRFDSIKRICVERSGVELAKQIPTNAVIAFSPSELASLADSRKNIGIFFWTPSETLTAMIGRTPTSDIPMHRIEFLPEAIESLPSMFDDYLTRIIAQELTGSIQSLQHITNASRLLFSMGTTKNRMCPLFHVDRVHMRMIVTLRGPGTEWLADDDVNRSGLGKLDNSKVVRKLALLQQVDRFQVAFLKGKLFSGGRSRGVVHRSPAVETASDGRWFVKVDVLDVHQTK